MLKRNKLINCVAIWLVLMVLMYSSVSADIIKVDSTATGNPPDGLSWPTAFRHLQDALADAQSGDDIWVAEGIYKPDQNKSYPLGTGSREATFQMKFGVEIYGGFPTGGGNWSSRDPSTHETILSGDINEVGVNTDNSYHVVNGSGTSATAVLDGFTIKAGYANGYPPHNKGGGMYISYAHPTVTNCVFKDNWAYEYGGGMYNSGGSPTVTNCTFSGNSTDFFGGGGMYNSGGSPTVTNCTFSGNSSYYARGGGMYNGNSNPTVTNCTFSWNAGGGMYNSGGSPTVTNCTFSGNTVESGDGGGMYNRNCILLKVTNSTFSGNSSNYGGGVYNSWSSPTVTNCTFSNNSAIDGGGMLNESSDTVVVNNCIFWGNTATEYGSQIDAYSSAVTIHYCDVQGGIDGVYEDPPGSITWTGINEIRDPLFVDADGPDNITGTDDDNLRLLAGSPCINAGDNDVIPLDSADLDGDGNTSEPIPFDLDGNLRIAFGYVDMGAYEYGSAFADIGLRLYDGTEVVSIACEAEGSLTSPLRIAKDGIVYGILLVDPGDSRATGIRIETASGTKALARLE
jgi:parallel beta-helix repeat protein